LFWGSRRGFRIAAQLLGERAEAEDVLQEALARACAHFHRLDQPGALEAWFYRTVTNLCVSALRRRRVRRALLRLWPGDARVPAPSAEGARLARALDRLPARQRVALELRYGQELAPADIAALLGVGEGTVKTHLARGLSRLRQELGVTP
jgi:DNA-directed RNA polymerase specialized sigma24 family protein